MVQGKQDEQDKRGLDAIPALDNLNDDLCWLASVCLLVFCLDKLFLNGNDE